MKILVSNVGSTSLKFKLYEMPSENVLCTGKVERVGSDDAIFDYVNVQSGFHFHKEPCSVPSYSEGIALFEGCMRGILPKTEKPVQKERCAGTKQSAAEYATYPPARVIDELREVNAVGFKTVAARGYNGIHELTDEVLAAMREYLPVAPAHNTAYLEAIACFREMLPGVRFIGAFETAFHQTIPPKRKVYSTPYEWFTEYGVQKLGYHGASHSYAASVLERIYGTTGKAVTCHLGGSGSICAVEDGKSVDTSFGMSLQVGLPQNNRVGDLDPYVLRYMESKGFSEEELFEALTTKSGLLGISGVGRDLRYLMDAAAEGNDRAQLAIDLFANSILHYIGAYAAEMGGLDNLVFTGGIGENSDVIRAMVTEKLGFLGLTLDQQKNASLRECPEDFPGGVHVISTPDSRVRVLVIPADEEIVVGRKTYEYITK